MRTAHFSYSDGGGDLPNLPPWMQTPWWTDPPRLRALVNITKENTVTADEKRWNGQGARSDH